jgi:hypothetical protein
MPSRLSMKILFVLRTAGWFPYHQTTIDHLIARGHQVTLLFESKVEPPDDRGFQEWRASGRRITVGEALRRRGLLRRPLFVMREIRSYAGYCRRGSDVTFYRERWRRYLPLWLQGVLARSRFTESVLRSQITDRLLAALERTAPPSLQIVSALRRDKPDCVVASPTNLLADEEVEYIKAANALGIPSIVPVLSWDNLTTKGLIHVRPDFILAWHHGHAEEARAIHGIPADRIIVTGSPFFDKWFDATRRLGSRTAACRRIGIDPSVPYLLYLGSSANIARDESWLVLAVVRALREAHDPQVRRLQVVFKPYPGSSPRNLRVLPRLDEAGILVRGREHGRPNTTEGVGQLRDMLHHAAAVIGINTTGMIDAILCDRPCLALAVKRYRSTQTDTMHFRRMQESKALWTTRSVRGAVQAVSRILGGDDPTAAARRRFVATYARPRGVGAQAGEAAALAIELVCGRMSGAAITRAIDLELRDRPLPDPPPVEADPDEAVTAAG